MGKKGNEKTGRSKQRSADRDDYFSIFEYCSAPPLAVCISVDRFLRVRPLFRRLLSNLVNRFVENKVPNRFFNPLMVLGLGTPSSWHRAVRTLDHKRVGNPIRSFGLWSVGFIQLFSNSRGVFSSFVSYMMMGESSMGRVPIPNTIKGRTTVRALFAVR